MKKLIIMLVLGALAASSQATLYFYDGFDYAAGTRLDNVSSGTGVWGNQGVSPQPTNRAGSLTYSGLPASTGGRVQLAGQNGGNAIRGLWSNGGLNNTNLFASFLLNVASLGSVSNNGANFIFSLRNNVRGQVYISNNVNNSANFNIGLANLATASQVISWDTGVGGNGYSLNTTLLIAMCYTNSGGAGTVWSERLWINPTLGSTDPVAANLSIAGTGLSATNSFVSIGNGGGQGFGTTVMYVDELRVGSTWADVTPIPEPATVGMLGLGALVTLLIRRMRN